MEALTAVAVAALTIYDMVKAVDKTMVIGDIRRDDEDGGRSATVQARQAVRIARRVTVRSILQSCSSILAA